MFALRQVERGGRRGPHCDVPTSAVPGPAVAPPGPPPFVHRLRVRFAETDAMGIVHHGAYAVYLEAARVEYLRASGHPYQAVRDDGLDFAVVELAVRYERPMRFDDVVAVSVTVPAASRAWFDMAYQLSVGATRCATARSRHAAVGPDGRPRRLPTWVAALAPGAPPAPRGSSSSGLSPSPSGP